MQDRPLQTWYLYNDKYVEESLRREGHGSAQTHVRCAGVRGRDPRARCANPECKDKNAEAEEEDHCRGEPLWRCVDAACLGEIMQCEDCIVAAHA